LGWEELVELGPLAKLGPFTVHVVPDGMRLGDAIALEHTQDGLRFRQTALAIGGTRGYVLSHMVSHPIDDILEVPIRP
jgi:hypothetical protein